MKNKNITIGNESEPFPPVEQSSDKFSEFINVLNEKKIAGTELLETAEVIAKEWIESYAIRPTFFDSQENSLIFLLLANRCAEAKSENDVTFTEASLLLLAKNHSDNLKSEYENSLPNHSIDENEAQRVYDQFTDKEVTRELRQAIEAGLLDSVKTRLGITNENEDEYDVRAINAMSDDVFMMMGLSRYDEDKDLVDNWKDGIIRRGDEFRSALGETTSPPAWVVMINGRKTLCMPSPLVEKILNPEVINEETVYGGFDRHQEDIMAFLEHEYTHTQGSHNCENDTCVGIILEELRAEEYSGNKHGYGDIKSFANDYSVITGNVLVDYSKETTKGGSAFNVYMQIIKDVGPERALELLLTRPNAYVSNSDNGTYNEAVDNYLGGTDALCERLLEDAVAAGKGSAVVERVTKRTMRLIEIFDGDIDKLRDILDLKINIHKQKLMNTIYLHEIDQLTSNRGAAEN